LFCDWRKEIPPVMHRRGCLRYLRGREGTGAGINTVRKDASCKKETRKRKKGRQQWRGEKDQCALHRTRAYSLCAERGECSMDPKKRPRGTLG